MTKDEVMGYIGLGLVALGSFGTGFFVGHGIADLNMCHILDTSGRALNVANKTLETSKTVIKEQSNEIKNLKACILDMQEKKDI